MDEKSFEKEIINGMKEEYLCKVDIPNIDSKYLMIHRLFGLTVGRADSLFCNTFIMESVILLRNALQLAEQGYFDCSFYSLRQSGELCNNMLYLADGEADDRKKWINKDKFPPNSVVIKKIAKISTFYRQIKDAVPEFYHDYDELNKKANKIIHKQGFDTFYCGQKTERNLSETSELFVEMFNKTICLIILMCISVDPLCLALADNELSPRINFDPMAEAVDVEYIKKFISEDALNKIKQTDYFKEFSEEIMKREPMKACVYEVIRESFFDLSELDEIKTQEHLLGLNEKIILEILQTGVVISNFYPNCEFMGYCTSAEKIEYSNFSWSREEYEKNIDRDEIFNLKYGAIYRSYFKGIEHNWLLEHNDELADTEIEKIRAVFETFREQWKQALNILESIVDSIKTKL